MKHLRVVLLSMMLMSSPVMAAAVSDQDARLGSELVRKLKPMLDAGTKLDRRQLAADGNALRLCAAEMSPKRDATKALRPQAQKIEDFALQLSLTMTVDETFSCLYCAGNGEACAAAARDLAEAEKRLAQ